MPQYYRMAAVFRAGMLKGRALEVVTDPVKIEVKDGPITLTVPAQHLRVHVIGEKGLVMTNTQLQLPANERFIILTARSKIFDRDTGRFLENCLDTTIAKVSVLFQPQLFFEEVYRGPLIVKARSDPTKN